MFEPLQVIGLLEQEHSDSECPLYVQEVNKMLDCG